MNTTLPTSEPAANTVVVCMQCRCRFRAPTDDPSALIECPGCGATSWRDALPEAPEPPARARGRRRRHGWLAVFGILLSLAILGGVAHLFRTLRPDAAAARRAQEASAGASAARRAIDAAALQEARAAAERALGAADWTDSLPFVLDADRVRPHMAQYHARHPWTPLELAESHDGRIVSRGNVRAAQLQVRSGRGDLPTLHLRHTTDGWKLDWERLVNFRWFAWQAFCEAPPAAPVTLDCLALRGSASEAHYAAARLTAETGLAVRLDGPLPGYAVLAIVPKASDLGRLLQRELTWDHPRQYRCSLQFIDPGLVPPLAEIGDFSGEGWREEFP